MTEDSRSEREFIDLALVLLDRQLLDSDDRRCGKVDDLEIEGEPGGQARVTALMSGPSSWSSGSHGPLAWMVARIAGAETVRIPVETVESAESTIKLRSSAQELGLGKGDDRAGRWLRGLPKS